MFMTGNYFFLSNFYPCEIKYNNHMYQNVEAAFQAQKVMSAYQYENGEKPFIDEQVQFTKLAPNEAKHLGRKVKLRPDWESIKLRIMEDLLRIKFSDPELARKLKAVNEPIVEDNTWNDRYWGVCDGKGQNNLGKLLTKIKNEL